jgi:butyryl-CoA dehydrogenase
MFQLTEEQRAILNSVESYTNEFIWPNAPSWDEKEHFPMEAFKKAAELGLAGLFASEQYGGSQLSRLDGALIFEEIATGCVSTSAFLSIHNMVVGLIDKYATADVKKTWLPQLISFQSVASYCLTEPHSGSDAAALKTTAKDCGDYYLVNGSKAFISGAGISDVYATMVRTGGEGYKGISCLLIPKSLPGVRFGQKEKKMGWRNQPTAMVYFEDCKVPKSHLLGEEGMGFRYALGALNGGRLNIAACSLGGARKAMHLTERYMHERAQFGKPLKDIQALRFYFSKMLMNYEASRNMLINAAQLFDAQDKFAPRYCAMAKHFVTEHCNQIIDLALQIHGGYGYLHDYHIERIYRDCRVNEILEGTNEIMCEIIAKYTLDDEQPWQHV